MNTLIKHNLIQSNSTSNEKKVVNERNNECKNPVTFEEWSMKNK